MSSPNPDRPYAHIQAHQQPAQRDTVFMEPELAHVLSLVIAAAAGFVVALWWRNQVIDPTWSETIFRGFLAFAGAGGVIRVMIAVLNIERAVLYRR